MKKHWVVFRHGWNAANQPSSACPERMLVAEVEADSLAEACELAAERVSVYVNQRLSAEPRESLTARDVEIDRRVKLRNA